MSNNNKYYVMHGVALLPSAYEPNVDSIKELPKDIRRELQKHGYRFTLVGRKHRDNSIFVAYAFCSSKDNFSRKAGRKIATSRVNGFFEKMGASDYVVSIVLSDKSDVKNDIANSEYLQSILQEQASYHMNYNNADSCYYNPSAFKILF